MREDIKTEWVARLRDPNEKQTSHMLERTDAKGNVTGRCCLGVLCDIAVSKGAVNRYVDETGERTNRFGVASFDTQKSLLPNPARLWAELSWSSCDRLMALNDGGAPFSEIADYIDAHWEGM